MFLIGIIFLFIAIYYGVKSIISGIEWYKSSPRPKTTQQYREAFGKWAFGELEDKDYSEMDLIKLWNRRKGHLLTLHENGDFQLNINKILHLFECSRT